MWNDLENRRKWREALYRIYASRVNYVHSLRNCTEIPHPFKNTEMSYPYRNTPNWLKNVNIDQYRPKFQCLITGCLLLSIINKTLVQCPYGTAGRNCNKCVANTYADIPGLPACKQCDTGKITEQIGSVRKSQCIKPRKVNFNIIFEEMILFTTKGSYISFLLIRNHSKGVLLFNSFVSRLQWVVFIW